jgi:Fe-S-cluster containining protein
MNTKVFPPGEKPLGENPFCFDCHPDVGCFGMCCKDVDMYLYPYDIIRMKKRLEMDSQAFLEKHTFSAFRDNPFFPSVMLKMADVPKKPCPFLVPQGCSIYEDRPSSCRTYPLERGVSRAEIPGGREDFYFLKRADHCMGHAQDKQWQVAAWVIDQQIQLYNEMNDLWVDLDSIFRANPWGEGPEGEKKFRMAFMACFNVDRFRDFVLSSSFLTRFDIAPERTDAMRTDDVAMMMFGFEWVRFFLTGRPLSFD